MRKPVSASAALMFTAVVVFPTPPFWFMMAIDRISPSLENAHYKEADGFLQDRVWWHGVDANTRGVKPSGGNARAASVRPAAARPEFLPIWPSWGCRCPRASGRGQRQPHDGQI